MYKKLSKAIREYKKPMFVAMIMMALEVFSEILIPFLMAKLLDNGLIKGDIQYVLKMGGLMFLFVSSAMFFGIIGSKKASEASVGFSSNLREDIFENIQTFSFKNLDKFSSSTLITRLTTDISNIQNSFQMILKTIVRAPFMIVFVFIMSSYTNLKLTTIIMLVIPFLGGILIWLIYKVHPYFVSVYKKYDLLNQIVQEEIIGIRVVKSFVREKFEILKFQNISEDIKRNFIKAEKITAINSPLMQAGMYVTLLLVYWFGSKSVINGEMTTGQLTSFISYMMQILNSLMMISTIFVMIVISEASVERISDVISEKSTISTPLNDIKKIDNGSLEFKNVYFKYSDSSEKPDLQNINFSIAHGESIGIIGGTGSGKSTLAQLIPRLYDVNSGEIFVSGHNVNEYDLNTLRNQISMVLQKNTLFSGTINDNLRWGNKNASKEEIQHMAALAQADEFVREFPDGYETILEQGGNNLSGGQKQRLTIARALLKKPKILILDDSTSAIDSKTDYNIQLAFLNEIPDTTKIIVSQRISSIQYLNRIIVLNKGEINGIGTHDELIRNNTIYQEVYQSQMKGVKVDSGI